MTAARTSPLTEEFKKLVYRKLEDWRVPGVSIAIVHNDKVYAEGYGIATYPAEKVTASTLFYPGSTTKAFLGAAWAQLIESEENRKKDNVEKLAYDTPLSSLIRDDFVLQDEYATNHVTIEDSLSHRSGVGMYTISYGGSVDTPKKITRSLRHFPMSSQLRTKYEYSNVMYIAASHALEAVTGQWLGKTLKDRIWDPLGMSNTFFTLQDAKKAVDAGKAKLATGYLWEESGTDPGNGQYQPLEAMDFPEVSGAGAIISNVLDYAEWLKALMNQSAPLNKEIVAAMTSPRTILIPSTLEPYDGVMTYALGWAVTTYNGEPLMMHKGGLVGFGAHLMYLPKQKWGAVLLGNTSSTSNMAEESLCLHLLDEFLGVPPDKRADIEARDRKILKDSKERSENARERLYPSAPTPGTPYSLPLEAYAGTYCHPGYRSLTFSIRDYTNKGTSVPIRVLVADSRQDRTWRVTFRLEHVTSEHWIAYLKLASWNENITKAEFRIGEDGKVSELGIACEEAWATDEEAKPYKKAWFKKVVA